MQTATAPSSTVFTPIQLQLLNMFSRTSDEQTLTEVRQVLSEYFARKAEEGMELLWKQGLWSAEKNQQILNTHLRTPYEA